MNTSDTNRTIFDDDPLLVTEKKKFFPSLGMAWLMPVCSIVLIFVAFGICAVILPDVMTNRLLLCIVSILLYCGLLAIMLLYSYYRKKKVEPDYKLIIKMPSTPMLLTGPFLMLALYVFVFGMQEWFHLSMLTEWDSSVFLIIREAPVFYCLIYFSVDPLIQEILMRGIILDSFLKKYTPLKAILNVAAISCLFNLSYTSFVYVICFSVMQSWIYLKTKQLGNTIYMQLLCGLIPFLLTWTLRDNLSAQLREVFNSPVWVGGSALMGIICIIILQTSFSQPSKN